MSSFTKQSGPRKRTRTYSDISNPSVRHTLSMDIAPRTRVYCTPKREVGGSAVQKAGSKGKRKTSVLNWSKYLSYLFPPASFRHFNYGVDMYENTGASFRNNDSKGGLKAITSLPTRQRWVEFIGLPLYNPELDYLQPNGKVGNLTIRTLFQLMQASWNNTLIGENMGYQVGSYVKDGIVKDNNGASPEGIGSPGSVFNENLMQQRMSFCYNGGYQRHTFKNQSQAQAFIEVWELHPRERTFDWEVSSANHDFLHFHSVGEDLLHDLKVASSNPKYFDDITAMESYPPGMEPTYDKFDSVNDLGVRINKKCQRVLCNYKVSSPVRVCLAPGEVFQYTMGFDGFTFDNAEFMQMLESIDININQANSPDNFTSIKVRPTTIPKFTKRLCMRFWGEQGAAKNDNQQGTVLIEGAVPVYLIHTQEEYHSCRYMPAVNTNYYVVNDQRDTDSTASNLLVVNDETGLLVDPDL